jgi:hypothetical protein
MVKLRNIFLVLKDQGPPRRFFRNLFKGHLIGILNQRSHLTESGTPKVKYNTKKTAEKSARAMSKKRGDIHFSNYKCLYCDGYHIGKNSENKG